ncbi:MAG: 2,3-bisphosphoglycerate-independent phosphoglycerate mutase [Methanosarcinales archaeon]|nr:2,3-bisphosphoglycerate-independent phosphoglycerate mutase [Methanosarcinales archaeon]
MTEIRKGRCNMLILIILDGFGLSESDSGNAIAHANTPNLDRLRERYPTCTLSASGEAVGLPDGQMGNSEVGHLNIGAGRVVYQDLTRISKAISDKTFFENPVILKAVEHAKTHDSCLHLMGLVSDGGVHSHLSHLLALMRLASEKNVRAQVHAFLDGRDVPPRSALEYINAVDGYEGCRIGTVSGRYYAMDRDNRWERVEKAYRALVAGEGESAVSAEDAVLKAYERGEDDEFVLPTAIEGSAPIADRDSIIFFNFRPDRARQITRAFVDSDFDHFKRRKLSNLYFACMTEYDATIDADVAYPHEKIKNTLGEVLSRAGLRQLRIAETEKYAHVTFFFNGGVEAPNPGEDRCLIPSPKVATYDLLPEMSAYEVTDALLERIGSYDVVILNYANCDMVGHTGIFEAAVTAVETVDSCVGRVEGAVRKIHGSAIIIADHGNAEVMAEEDGTPHTAHTTNPVPLILVSEEVGSGVGVRDGKLADVAPTILELLGIPKPAEMTGESVIVSGRSG